MSTYSKFLCPNCNSQLKGWHRSYVTFGNPLVRCNSCNMIVRMSHLNEWEAMTIFQKIYYYILFYGQAIIFGGAGAGIFGIFFDEFFKSKIFVVDDSPTSAHVVLIISITIGTLLWRHVKFQKAIQDSKERTSKDPVYRKALGIKY